LLAKNWSTYSDERLEDYSERFYQSLRDNYSILTPRTQGLMPYMINHNWLVSYQTIEGIGVILAKMDTRMKYESNMRFSITELELFYSEFENEFTVFFEDLITITVEKNLFLATKNDY
jgi:acyl carrier protein phosphodiesterase